MNVLTVVLSHVYSRNLIEARKIGFKEEILGKALSVTCKLNLHTEEAYKYFYSVDGKRYVNIEMLNALLKEYKLDMSMLDQRDMYYVSQDINNASLSKMTSALVIMWLTYDTEQKMNFEMIFNDLITRSEYLLEAICF